MDPSPLPRCRHSPLPGTAPSLKEYLYLLSFARTVSHKSLHSTHLASRTVTLTRSSIRPSGLHLSVCPPTRPPSVHLSFRTRSFPGAVAPEMAEAWFRPLRQWRRLHTGPSPFPLPCPAPRPLLDLGCGQKSPREGRLCLPGGAEGGGLAGRQGSSAGSRGPHACSRGEPDTQGRGSSSNGVEKGPHGHRTLRCLPPPLTPRAPHSRSP